MVAVYLGTQGKAVKWDNSYVSPIVAASQSPTRPTCIVLRIFLALLAFPFALEFC